MSIYYKLVIAHKHYRYDKIYSQEYIYHISAITCKHYLLCSPYVLKRNSHILLEAHRKNMTVIVNLAISCTVHAKINFWKVYVKIIHAFHNYLFQFIFMGQEHSRKHFNTNIIMILLSRLRIWSRVAEECRINCCAFKKAQRRAIMKLLNTPIETQSMLVILLSYWSF